MSNTYEKNMEEKKFVFNNFYGNKFIRTNINENDTTNLHFENVSVNLGKKTVGRIETAKNVLEEKTDVIGSSNSILPQQDLEIDSNLSKIFYEFLTAKSNNLPTSDYVKEISKDSNDEFISVGYGVTVMNDGAFKVICGNPKSEKLERVDIITPEDHIAFYQGPIARYNINLEKEPIFSTKRVEIVQEYLDAYTKEFSSQKEKNKSKIK